jgi:hypothetical protein
MGCGGWRSEAAYVCGFHERRFKMNMEPKDVVTALTTFADFLMTYFATLAAVGAFTMALIETYKKLTDSRTKFHFNFVKKFINEDEEARNTSQEINENPEIQKLHSDRSLESILYSDSFSELIHLVSGVELKKAQSLTAYEKGNLLAIFSLESENMMGKIQDAVDAAIDNPERHPNLFIFSTSGSNTDDAIEWIKLANTPILPDASPQNVQIRSALYTRLHQLAKRKLDRLQLQLTTRYTNLNQSYAIFLGGFILFVTLMWINRKFVMEPLNVGIIFVASTVGGILSPIAKDMISWLQKVKSRG